MLHFAVKWVKKEVFFNFFGCSQATQFNISACIPIPSSFCASLAFKDLEGEHKWQLLQMTKFVNLSSRVLGDFFFWCEGWVDK